MTRFKILLVAISITFSTSFAQLPDGVRLMDYGGINYPIFGLGQSAEGKYLLISAYGGRFYMLDASSTEEAKNAFSQKEKQLWQKNLNGFKWGCKPSFSSDSKYVLLKPTFDDPYVTKLKPTKCIVVESATGNTVYERGDEILGATFLNSTTLLLSTNDGLEFVDLNSKKITKKLAMPQVEAIAASRDGKTLALSYYPEKIDFAELNSVDYRKREIKNAIKNKRLILIFDVATMKEISKIDDEIDVVFRMKFSPDDKDLILFTRNHTKGFNENKNNLKQESSASTLMALNLLKLNVKTGIIDRGFYYRSFFIHLDFDISPDGKLFAYSSTNNTPAGLFKITNGLEVYDYNVPDDLKFEIKTRFKFFKKFSNPYQFSFKPDMSSIYFSSGGDLVEWDYKILPKHVFNGAGSSDEDVAASAINQLDSLSNTIEFKEKITKNNIQGMYVYDVTVFKKGQVATVFSPTDEVLDIRSHNFLLDYLKAIKLEDLNIPKDKRVKFRYTFNIDNSQ
jgi:hypothetical protein